MDHRPGSGEPRRRSLIGQARRGRRPGKEAAPTERSRRLAQRAAAVLQDGYRRAVRDKVQAVIRQAPVGDSL